jgi:hypothetical protein
MATTKKAPVESSSSAGAKVHTNGARERAIAAGAAIKPPNGECPFTEEDAQEVYEDRYDFFRREMNLPKDEAKRRASRSTDAWRQEILGHAHT